MRNAPVSSEAFGAEASASFASFPPFPVVVPESALNTGCAVGSGVGAAVGLGVGVAVGSGVGVAVGVAVGAAVGATVGVAAGAIMLYFA